MKVTVIGAGSIGSAVVQTLLARDEVEHVQVCDSHARSLQNLQTKVKRHPKLRSFQVDARDAAVLEPILSRGQVAIACTDPAQNPMLARLCLDLGIHFCDLGGDLKYVDEQLRLDEAARTKSIWIVPNCGLAPGLANVLCVLGMEQFDEVDTAQLRVGDVPLHPEPPFNFRVAWSANRIIHDYTMPAEVIEEGQLTTRPSLSDLEDIHFAPPFTDMEAFSTAGSLSTLTRDLVGRLNTLDYKAIRWPGHASQMQFLLGLGFGEERYIDVRTHLTYRDVLVRRMRQRLSGHHPDAVLLRVLVRGIKDGVRRTLVYEMIETYDEAYGMTAMKRATALPTTTLALMIASRAVPGGGAAPPEMVVPKATYCDLLRESGLNITERWYEGYVGVTQPSDAA